MLLVTHDSEAAAYADHLQTLRDGRLTDEQPSFRLAPASAQ